MALATPVLLVGCGRMGGALLASWRTGELDASGVTVIEPDPAQARRLHDLHGVRVVAEADDIAADFRPATLVLAVKPQVVGEAAPACRRFTDHGALVLSVVAGRTLAWFESVFGNSAAVVRTMPNTPAAIGRGITAMVANSGVTAEQREAAEGLMGAVGETVWLDDEDLMDAVTAVSGGGPAYVFLLIETMTRAGIASGLPDGIAARLARATVCGAGELALRSDRSPEQLRRDVTSPGGTTLEALNVLMAEDGIQPLFDRAIAAATRRSGELGRRDCDAP